MAESLATLGLIVDASGAKREIKATAEQLKILANGGKEAQAVLKQIAPPQAVQQIAAVKKEVAATNTLMTANIQATQRAGASINGLREPLTNATRALLGLNPAVAQLSSVLGNFALGSGPMIAILAGVAALSFAWNKLTEDTRKAEAATAASIVRLQGLLRQQREGDFGSTKGDVGSAWAKLLDVTGDIRDLEGRTKGMHPESRKVLDGQIAILRERQAKLLTLIRAGNAEIEKVEAEHQKKLEAEREQAWNKQIADEQERMRAVQSRILWDPTVKETSLGAAGMTRVGGVTAPGKIGPEVFATLTREAGKSKNALELMTRAMLVLAHVTEEEARKKAVQSMAANAGLSMLTQYGGAAGGVIAAGIQGNMQAGPWGMAIGGGTALISTLVGMGAAAREAAKAADQLRMGLAATISQWKLDLGEITPKQAREERIRAEAKAARDAAMDAAEKEKDAVSPWTTRWHKDKRGREIDAARDLQLKEIDRIEKARIDALTKEKDAVDKLARSSANLVEGYKYQATIFKYAKPKTQLPPTWYEGGGGPSGPTTINVMLPDGSVLAKAVVDSLSRTASAQYGDSSRWAEVRP